MGTSSTHEGIMKKVARDLPTGRLFFCPGKQTSVLLLGEWITSKDSRKITCTSSKHKRPIASSYPNKSFNLIFRES